MRGGERGETRVFGTARAAAGCLGALTFQRITRFMDNLDDTYGL